MYEPDEQFIQERMNNYNQQQYDENQYMNAAQQQKAHERDSALVTAEMILNETLHTEDLDKSYQNRGKEDSEDEHGEYEIEPDKIYKGSENVLVQEQQLGGLHEIAEEESKLQTS